MSSAVRIVLVAALAAALAACGGPDGNGPGAGIRGLVLIGPQCPVVQEGVPCPDAPFAAEIVVRRAGDGDIVTTVRSGADGRFEVALEPGRYRLEPVSPNGGAPPAAAAIEAEVAAGAYTPVTILYDSGIR